MEDCNIEKGSVVIFAVLQYRFLLGESRKETG